MKNIDWTSFRKRIIIAKPIEVLFQAWATKENMETWFLEKALYFDKSGSARKPNETFQKGDSFIWKWHNWDFDEKGEILESNGKDKIAFTFGNGGKVYVKLIDVAGSTEVILTQTEIPTDEESKMNYYVGCATGWTFWMANLKAWLEYGVLLHAKGLTQADTADLVNS